MLNETIRIKLKQRLNKLSSNDFDNIENWQILEAFNKAQIEWVRRQLHGNNIYKEGDELSKRRVDDLQILLQELSLTGVETERYLETDNFPINTYLEYKRVSTKATNDCCPEARSMTVYLAEEANVELIYRDELKRPDFEWGETFCTLIGNTIRIYRRDFTIVQPVLTYYRKPILVEFLGVLNPYTSTVSTANVLCEFKDDIVELIIDETASIIAGDIENMIQMQREQQSAERNN
tara:strand:+ start:11571 stop:12275 length:705 start_codon:yes stop_codon:yes gene_type:complete